MDKLDMQSKNLVDGNIDKIAKLFPNCITEGKNEDGKVVKLVDFDLLKQELSKEIVEGNDERYTLNWAGKKQAILTANSPINATLRPYVEESVGKDGTPGGFDSQNLYIEGDNLDVLKLLRETYLGKVKMIYIDPPYNTGNDFVYEDDFVTSAEEYLQNSKSYDEQGNRMFQNNESNGRFHSDWLSMMYARLKLARDLLTDDGVIFISIDDNEITNLHKICDEIFGSKNYISEFVWQKKSSGGQHANYVLDFHEYILCYARDINNFEELLVERTEEQLNSFDNEDKYVEIRGKYLLSPLKSWLDYRPTLIYDIECPDGSKINTQWICSRTTFEQLKTEDRIVFKQNPKGEWSIYKKQYSKENGGKVKPASIIIGHGQTANGKKDLKELFNKDIMSFPKPVELIKYIISSVYFKNKDIILDFFSGSATTAHAVMQLNAADGGNRKFIMVQLPELCDEKSEAYKAGYKNICEIGKERIRRAGKKIKEDRNIKIDIDKNKLMQRSVNQDGSFDDKYALKVETPNEEYLDTLDIGFRVLKLDSSCMKDVYYSPSVITQGLLFGLEDNIKEDRTAEDLLFQVMLDMGVILSSEIKTLDICGKKVFNVNDGNLVCCFDTNLTDEVVTEIAKMQPLYAVFRDSSMSTDSVAVNFDQIFETYSPTTTRKVL